jgi:hypothetical protein
MWMRVLTRAFMVALVAVALWVLSFAWAPGFWALMAPTVFMTRSMVMMVMLVRVMAMTILICCIAGRL